ncbi:PA2928 family protein [Terribacillus sp. 179-K 1B1 HS]|uniref:PA2928 family protein n=1 Tax=Terribacillus sp. 179-K 1B1 HS TaxID=3142388 RepID=UPI00399FEF53
MTDIFRNWLFNDDFAHNVMLTLIYIWILTIIGKWAVDKIKQNKQRTFGSLAGFLLVHAVLGTLLLWLLEGDFFNDWTFTGWFWHDLTLWILGGLFVVLCMLFLVRGIKRSSSLKKVIGMIIFLLVGEFIIGSFVMTVFHAAGRSVTMSLDSPTIIAEDSNLAINKIRMKIPNGHENGISLSDSRFQIIAVDLDTGEMEWSRKASWQVYVLGRTEDGIMIMNRKAEELYFLDAATGEVRIKEQEWTEKYPELTDNLSYEQADYYIDEEGSIYLYALNGKYYRIADGRLTEDPAYEKEVQKGFFGDEENGEAERAQQTVQELYPDLLEAQSIIGSNKDGSMLLMYKEKRNQDQVIIARVSTEESVIRWKVAVDYDYQEIPGETPVDVFLMEDATFVQAAGKLYKVSEPDGALDFVYQYRWNKKENITEAL